MGDATLVDPGILNGIMPASTLSSNELKSPRTLILCFDGTADQFADQNTNVVKLYSLLKKEDSEQLCYYQPGVGTYLNDGVVSPFFQWGAKILDQGVAWYLDAHVRGGYQFLMQNYRPGDKICLFGFSRGAYTARALAGMLHKIGLLPKDNVEQVPFAYKLYKRTDPNSVALAVGYKRTFCRSVQIEFVGVWDTVASVGTLVSRTLPFIANNTTIKTFRHALALDEHRAKFRPNLYHRPDPSAEPQGKTARKENVTSPPPPVAEDMEKSEKTFLPLSFGSVKDRLSRRSSKRASKGADWANLSSPRESSDDEEIVEQLVDGTDVREVWFAGCHTDVGGSSVSDSAPFSLADITLHWMVRQIVLAQCGIVFDQDALDRVGIPASVFAGEGFPLAPPIQDEKHRFPSHGADPGSSSTAVEGEDKHMLGPDAEALEILKPHALQPMHDQLKIVPLWWILEILPTSYNWQERSGRWRTSWSIHLGQGRHLPAHPNFHISVKERMDDKSLHYHPRAIWNPGSEVYVE